MGRKKHEGFHHFKTAYESGQWEFRESTYVKQEIIPRSTLQVSSAASDVYKRQSQIHLTTLDEMMSKLPIWSFSIMKPDMKREPVVMNILKNSMIIRIVLSSDELVWHNHQRKSRFGNLVRTDRCNSIYICHNAFCVSEWIAIQGDRLPQIWPFSAFC